MSKPTIASRLISKIKGISTTILVDAKNNPTVPPFCASHQDHSLEKSNPCWKDLPARCKKPLMPPVRFVDMVSNEMDLCVKELKNLQKFLGKNKAENSKL
jgi:hypothetical protein